MGFRAELCRADSARAIRRSGLEGFGLADHPEATRAAGALIHYLRETSAVGAEGEGARADALRHVDRMRFYEQADALVLDTVTVRNLELVAPLFAEDAARGTAVTLLAALDETVTGDGRPEAARVDFAAASGSRGN